MGTPLVTPSPTEAEATPLRPRTGGGEGLAGAATSQRDTTAPSPGAARRQFARLVAIEGDALTGHASGS